MDTLNIEGYFPSWELSSTILTFHSISWSHFILRQKNANLKISNHTEKCPDGNRKASIHPFSWKNLFCICQLTYLVSLRFLSQHRGVWEPPRLVLTQGNKTHFSRLLVPGGGNHLLWTFGSLRIYWKWMWVIYMSYLTELRFQLIMCIFFNLFFFFFPRQGFSV